MPESVSHDTISPFPHWLMSEFWQYTQDRFSFIIPGLIVWVFGLYDAYTTANKMNNQEIPFIPTNTAHMIIFFILVMIIVVMVIFLVVLPAMAVMFGSLARGMH